MTVHTVPALDLDDVRATLTAAALTDGAVGRVGLELEAQVYDIGDATRDVAWTRLTDALSDLGALPAGSRLTLEPGGQVELSTAPGDGVAAAVRALRSDAAALDAVLGNAGMRAVPIGADPIRPPTLRHDGARYGAMRTAFGAAGYAGPAATMMCSTASLQVNLDAGPRAGWARRITTVHALGPVLTAISACSPWLAGADTGWRSARMQAWQRLDPARTAPYAGLGEPAEAWAAFALAAPVLAVTTPGTTPGECTPVRSASRVPMVDWINGATLLDGRRPTADDLALHLTMLWPPLRLRGFLEIRSLDAVPARWWPGLAALVVGMVDGAPEAVAELCAPVATRWEIAARDGLADPALLTAARGCVAAALPHVPAELRLDAEAYAELVDGGRTPGDLLAAALAARGSEAVL